MQQEKIVLPKFTVPGQTNWVKWALVGVGGLVALSVVAFGVALSKRNSDVTATAAPKPADVPLAPSATPRPVSKPSATLAATATPAPDKAAAPAEAAPPPKAKAVSHRPRRTQNRTLARANSASSTSKSAGKSDPLDDILKRFK